MERYPAWVFIIGVLAGFGFGAWQLKTGTYSTKRRDQTSKNLSRAQAPVGWFFSTVGWFLVGAASTAALVYRAIAH